MITATEAQFMRFAKEPITIQAHRLGSSVSVIGSELAIRSTNGKVCERRLVLKSFHFDEDYN